MSGTELGRLRWRITDVVKGELISLGPNERAVLVSAMDRYRKRESFADEVVRLTKVVVIHEGRKYPVFEIKAALGKNQLRLLFAHVANSERVVLGLTAFKKKDMSTRATDIDRATGRLRTWLKDGSY
jgi:phage-related protein